MKTLTVIYNNVTYQDFTIADLITAGVPQSVIDIELLKLSKVECIASLSEAYRAACTIDVSFKTKAGETATFQADSAAVDSLTGVINGFSLTKSVPAGFVWIASNNKPISFVYEDVQGLAQVIATQSLVAFAKLQQLKAQIKAASTEDAVKAVVWA